MIMKKSVALSYATIYLKHHFLDFEPADHGVQLLGQV